MTRAHVVLLALLVWWFAVSVRSYGHGRVIGPFMTQIACETTRSAFGLTTTVPCWEGHIPGVAVYQ